MDELIIVLAVFLSYALICFWSIWYEFKKPIFMPFFIFKFLCYLGNKTSISNLPPKLDGLNKMAFDNQDYQMWLLQVNERGYIS